MARLFERRNGPMGVGRIAGEQGFVLPSASQITGTTSEIAPEMHDSASPDISFTTPSASQRGGTTTTPSASSKGAPTNFICVVTFTIFSPEKRQTKTKKVEIKWNAYKSIKNLAISFDTARIDWTTFQKMVRLESGKSFSTMPAKIEEGSKSDPPTITWSAYILRNEDYPKATPVSISSNTDFQNWIQTIIEVRAKRGGIVLTMENPQVKEQLAHKEALLAKSLCAESSQIASLSRPGASDEENSSCEDYEDLEIYVDEIYNKWGTVGEYDRKLPCFPHPTDSERYVLLTGDAVDTWGKALLKKTPGVSVESPPSSLKYKTRKKSPSKNSTGMAANAAPLDNLQLVAIATAVAQAQVLAQGATCGDDLLARRAPSPASSDDESGQGTMSAYLDFAGIVENKSVILEILLTNDIDQYHLFKPPHFSQENLLSIGLKIGTIAKLRSSVGKYKRHLKSSSSIN
ncbi:hypothetical protein PCASD_09639 [Puccinia coronata f. sp. avenae]|uniref:Uncharacterized protein n=1 Tax=Puccinia coronata f. sp. avenae TaxID=200324 RepID=A0A2N5UHX5_9BASI|nr:hypothetical protein PCASD_09639 [Puccinia coronata f. sp. avenae]